MIIVGFYLQILHSTLCYRRQKTKSLLCSSLLDRPVAVTQIGGGGGLNEIDQSDIIVRPSVRRCFDIQVRGWRYDARRSGSRTCNLGMDADSGVSCRHLGAMGYLFDLNPVYGPPFHKAKPFLSTV